ncbi:MAG: hypothetical protein RLZZ338_2655 [Cyanobacteriota bacterium]|jgi:CRISPR-associated protein Cmr2
MSEYTAISFAPVQGFIEKSRKLRDLFGASLLLSHLSFQLVEKAVKLVGKENVISPALINVQKGMPNRILVKGNFSRNDVTNTLQKSWRQILEECQFWIEKKIPNYQYDWQQEWMRWGLYSWEIFWGQGDSIETAINDLENRKLRRDWTALNWIGESSSLTGTDAIAWPGLGRENHTPGMRLSEKEQPEIKEFYQLLSRVLENLTPDDSTEPEGKFLAPNERLSIPELVKRLVTRDEDIARNLGMSSLDKGFTDIVREPGHWTGWFMGDGDQVGDKLKEISKQEKGDENLKKFSNTVREWGRSFEKDFPKQNPGRIVYAGGDDFLGVIYSEQSEQKISAKNTLDLLIKLPEQWVNLRNDLKDSLKVDFTFSVGFVWAGHSVPQRDVLQHCREAEKRAKILGRDRVTIRVLFNSGQYVQWTCPWHELGILKKYKDRDGKTGGKNPNWTHIYSDWEYLKSRHSIPLKVSKRDDTDVDDSLAIDLFNLYFNEEGNRISKDREKIVGNSSNKELINWMDGLIHIGWQLCSNI